MASRTDKIKNAIRAPKKEPVPRCGLSTGLTLLNLGISGKTQEAIFPDCYYLLVGDSKAGKTFIALNILAEASVNPAFKNYELIYDSVERGARMDIDRFFGPSLVERMRPPKGTWEQPECSALVEDFYYTAEAAFQRGPCIYVLDSMDSLVPMEDQDRFTKNKEAHEKGNEEKENRLASKARANSSTLRILHNLLPKHGSILIIICQTRQNIGWNATFNPKTRGGGDSLTFFCTGEVWFSIREKIKSGKIRGKERVIGTILKAQIKKNRDTGRELFVELFHYPSHGFDDVGSCVNFLIEERQWSVRKGIVTAPEFEWEGSEEDIIRMIESEGKEGELRQLVADVWQEIEEACAVQRKNRYASPEEAEER
jgi:hypothetical protein